MHYSLNPRHRTRRGLWVLLAVGMALAIMLLIYFLLRPAPAVAPVARTHAAPKPTSAQGGISSHLLFVGDVMWGRTIQTKAERMAAHYAYPTSGLTAADRAQYDAWVGNFECPVTTKDVPLSLQIDILKFNCRPEYLPNLAKWFTAGGLANNHAMNVDGQWGVEQSRSHLQQAGIQYFGNYDMSKLDDICEVIAVPATTLQTHRQVDMPVALCGYMQVVDVVPTEAQLAVMQRYAKVMPVIAFPHMGIEYRTTAEAAKVAAYRAMIDHGADAVIGAHPHVIQNSENYKGRLIAYSLGNFLFDQHGVSRDTTLGLGVGIRLIIQDEAAADIYAKVGPSCKTFQDDCLAQLSRQLTTRPKIAVSYNFACYDESNAVGGVPTLGTVAVCNLAKQKATVNQLGQLATEW